MTNLKLYSWGANSHGQLGLGFKSEQELASEVELPLNPDDIKQISCGARHAVILAKNGEIYVTGRNELNDSACNFTKIDLQIKFSQISCGWDVSAAIGINGKLFVWGSNSSNQLGLREKGVIKAPQELILPENEIPIDIKFGLKHSAILTKSNHILIVGSLRHFKKHAENYQIICHNTIEWLRVVMASDNDVITDYACGQNHVAFVIRSHIVCGIGDNKFGQCERVEASPLLSNDKIVKLESGWTHNAYLTESNELFLYGRNSYGQLGCGFKSASDFIAEPQKCPITPVERFSIGSEHCVLSSADNIYTFGWNEHRNCGHGTDEDILTPTQLPLSNSSGERKIRFLAAGSGFCVVLLEVS